MKLAVALDLPTPAENESLVEQLIVRLHPDLKPGLTFKVGLNTYIAGGNEFIKKVVATGCEVTLDLKLYDIPNTMAQAAKRIAELGVSMFTVHATAGSNAIREVYKAINCPDFPNPPKILAVTVLTSMEKDTCEAIYKRSSYMAAKTLIAQAVHGGTQGVVCSPVELPFVKGWVNEVMERQGPAPKLITFIPGIELAPRADDQKRKGGLKEVVDGCADYIVVGRPIYQDKNPADVAGKILAKIRDMQRLKSEYEEEAKWN